MCAAAAADLLRIAMVLTLWEQQLDCCGQPFPYNLLYLSSLAPTFLILIISLWMFVVGKFCDHNFHYFTCSLSATTLALHLCTHCTRRRDMKYDVVFFSYTRVRLNEERPTILSNAKDQVEETDTHSARNSLWVAHMISSQSHILLAVLESSNSLASTFILY